MLQWLNSQNPFVIIAAILAVLVFVVFFLTLATCTAAPAWSCP
jgi:hypothetical protein